ncbi:hypothetical protein [Chitinophaga polysaccharea]|uniref:hypothetical protein n=1 Tax=Chitinophaga polysaccharea TaxID=1293035 RepID=UPI001158457B|nr:hypothetical protein [Chitinophaga polysaccharea]
MKKALTTFSALVLSVLLTSMAKVGSDKYNNKNPPPPPQLTPVPCKLTLAFFNYSERSCLLPTNSGDPTKVDGAPALAGSINTTYFCKVTVEPNTPVNNYSPSDYTTIWKKKGDFLMIKVPKEVSSKLTVDFYEDCNVCTAGRQGRPYFRYTTTLHKGQPAEEAYLQYVLNTTCR